LLRHTNLNIDVIWRWQQKVSSISLFLSLSLSLSSLLTVRCQGTIHRNDIRARGLSELELASRERAFQEKKSKLKNPNMCVSATRLVVRQVCYYYYYYYYYCCCCCVVCDMAF
jgi:hypothetical protein